MKVLVTGSNGFVAHHLVEQLHARGDSVVGLDIAAEARNPVERYYGADLNNRAQVHTILDVERPDVLVHLAAASSVGLSWKDPAGSFLNNANIFLNLMEAIRELKLHPRILAVGSSEEYGACPAADMPLKEDHPLNPTSPYATAKVAQELMAKQYAAGYGLDIVMTRSFNQFGPGQRPIFAIPSFIEQILAAKHAGQTSVTLQVGNIDVIRDFLDVRDAASAYVALLEKGKAGEVYNVCSGTGHSLREIIALIANTAQMSVTPAVDPSRIRPTDQPIVIGCHDKLTGQLSWTPVHPISSTIQDIIH